MIFSLLTFLWSGWQLLRLQSLLVEGDRGTGTREKKDGRWAGSGGGGTGCGSHARAGGSRRMKNIKFFNDFLVCFGANYQKSEPKNIHYLQFYLEFNFIVSHESHRMHFSPFNVYNWHSSYIGQHTVMRKLDKTI